MSCCLSPPPSWLPLSSQLSGKQTGRRSLPIYCSYMTEDSEEHTIPESYWILLTSTVTFNLLHHSHSHFMLHTGSEFLFNVNWYTCFIASHQMAKWRTWQQLWVEPQKMLFNHWGYPLRGEETGHADNLADLIIQSSTYPMVTHMLATQYTHAPAFTCALTHMFIACALFACQACKWDKGS